MKYAVLESGSKQYRVSAGDIIDIELVPAKENLEFNQILMVADGDKVNFGTPHLSGASVTAKVINPEIKGKKEVIFKYKNKINYHKKTGHRQKYTRVMIEEIKHGT